MNRSTEKRKSPAFKAFLRKPSLTFVNFLNNLHTDDFDLLTKMALKVTLVHGGIASGSSRGQWVAFVRPSPAKSTSEQRETRKRLEGELSRARKITPFARGGTFKPRHADEAGGAARWLPRFKKMEVELRAALKWLPSYSRLCVCTECQKFFIRKTARHRDYCSRKCAGRASARVTMQQKRATERETELKRVRAALKSCPPGRDPKTWAAMRARVSKNWITYAAARGEVKL